MLLKLLDELLLATQAKVLCRLRSAETTPLLWVPLPGRYRKILLALPVVSSDCGTSKYPDACVIWIDAHADINTPETTDSGKLLLKLGLSFL